RATSTLVQEVCPCSTVGAESAAPTLLASTREIYSATRGGIGVLSPFPSAVRTSSRQPRWPALDPRAGLAGRWAGPPISWLVRCERCSSAARLRLRNWISQRLIAGSGYSNVL